MNRVIGHKLRWMASAGLLALLVLAPRLLAAPDDEDVTVREADGRDAPFARGEINLEANVFHGSGTASGGRKRFNSQLKLQLDELDRVCSLSAAEKEKLSLAGQGDIQRFFDRFEEVREQFEAVKHDQEAWQKIWPQVTPLQEKIGGGLFGDRSFFAKVARKTLSNQQQEKYLQVVDERRRFHYRASIESALVTLEDTVALRADQHEAIANMLAADAQPPLRFGRYDNYVIMSRIRRLSKDKLKHVLDQRQRMLLDQSGQLRDIDEFLVQQGYLSKEEVGGKAAQASTAEDEDGISLPTEFEPELEQ